MVEATEYVARRCREQWAGAVSTRLVAWEHLGEATRAEYRALARAAIAAYEETQPAQGVLC